jgi:hypothetical protein
MTLPRHLLPLVAVATVAHAQPMAPARVEGLNLNSFVQAGPVAAHILLRNGTDPRLLVAFPAGNSGVGLWFAPTDKAADWRLVSAPQATTQEDGEGRPLRGVVFHATIQASRLDLKRAVLSSVRVLRDYQALGRVPAGLEPTLNHRPGRLTWVRRRLDGQPGYRLSLAVEHGSLKGTTIEAGPDGRIGLAITALTGEVPLTPFASGQLLEPTAAADPQARMALRFLSYREKFLAGSWRFLTYFGRDTLLSVRLLMPALKPDAVETGLRSVLERLSPEGVVAHEEDIGEMAVLDHRRTAGRLSDQPTYNYSMVDSPFLLTPVAAAWLLDDPRGGSRAQAFLAGPAGPARAGDALMSNIRFVADAATAFARDARPSNLIGLKPGTDAGQWRDSNDGLGGGRYPYDVNAILVPAALEASADLARAGLLDPYARPDDRTLLAALPRLAAAWKARAPALFEQEVAPTTAMADVERFANAQSVPPGPALAAVDGRPLRYHAIALDAAGRPVPVMNSDEGFALLFARPDPQALDIAADTIARPFPAGLMTDVGMLVANPVFAPPALQARFSPAAYHGTVIWSWQQALAAAGLARQLARRDLPPATCTRLRTAQQALWRAIEAGRSMRNSELWSWRYAEGDYRIAPFGASGADADESNAAQLWSTVYLAVQKPSTEAAGCAR